MKLPTLNVDVTVNTKTMQKGIREALELSRLTGIRLRVAAKVLSGAEHRHFQEVVRPAIDADDRQDLDRRAQQQHLVGRAEPVERHPSLYRGEGHAIPFSAAKRRRSDHQAAAQPAEPPHPTGM